MLLGISPDYLYFQGRPPKPVSDVHNPYFLAFSGENTNIETVRNKLLERWEKNKIDHEKLSKIKEIGEIETYRSFCDFNKTRKVFKVYTKESYVVPDISSYLFFEHNIYTAEHDIPYKQRALTDLAAEDKVWLFDTHGEKKKVKVFVYDIETTQFSEGKKDIPIDIIGYSNFDISFESEKNLDNEQFSFEILDLPSHWEDIEVKQLISQNINEEIENLHAFCKMAEQYDIISGHNIAGFDNLQIYERIKGILNREREQLSDDERKDLKRFIYKYCRPDKSFHFGTSSEVVQFYPSSFDTYLAARKFYSFLDEFSLKALAPFLGIIIKDRIILTPSQIKIDERTLQYNKHDVQEQIGVTLNLIQQALPLAFTTCMPFDMLLPAGAVNMWDHMALIRGARHKKIIPPICRVKSISQTLLRDFKGCSTKAEIVSSAKKKQEQLSKDFVRVLKYGDEMPEWVEYPFVIYNENAKDTDDSLNYHMPGGMTIKPDSEAKSHFIPWYHVLVADVGAMYPTILKAMNVGADTIKLAQKNETPDEWIWLKKLPNEFLQTRNIHWREVTANDSFADKGYMLGIKIDPKQGVINGAMTGIMSMIAKIKNELKSAKEKGNPQDLQKLKMMYQSIKGARNAGTHGIMSAPGVTGRQFNLWGGATITTKGQHILADTLTDLENQGIRIVYGDSVDSDTDIITKERDIIKIISVKDLFDSNKNKIIRKGEHEYKTLNNIESLSVNKNGICEWKKVNFIKRHPYNGNILQVQTQRGTICVTMNHSLFTISNGFKQILCKDLEEKNNNIVHISKYKNKGKKIIINSLKPLIEFNNELNIWLNIPINKTTERLLKYHQHRNNFKGGTSKKKFIRMQILDGIDLYKKGIIQDNDIGNAFISSYTGDGKIPVVYELDEDFARIMGTYVAEGSIYIRERAGFSKEGAHIFTCGHNKQALEDLCKILVNKFKRKFNITSAGMDKNGEKFRIQGNSPTAFLYKFVLDCGQGSQEKKISPYILSSTKKVQKAFLDEYIKGDGYYDTKHRINPLLEITTKSKKLAEGLSLIAINLNYGFPSLSFREDKSVYRLRIVQYNLNSTDYKDLTGIIPKVIKKIKSKNGFLYDLSVNGNNNFVCASGLILAHNTDGIYLGCSRSAANIPDFSKSLELKTEGNEGTWLTKPDKALSAINECNKKWQKELNYPDFELEPEEHGAMIFVKHKNYLIFDSKDGKIVMNTKGNNFKGSDKANIARKALNEIMMNVLKENLVWEDEEDARKKVKESIQNNTKEIISKIDLTKVYLDDLTLVQSVQPAKRYKTNQDGSISTFGKRALALEKLLGRPIKTRIKLRFVVTKKPLPGIAKPSKSGVKPIDYMYPVDLLKDPSEIDLGWYKKMIENYIQGAFGLSDIQSTEQTGLDAWM